MTLEELYQRLEPIVRDVISDAPRTSDPRIHHAAVVLSFFMYTIAAAASEPSEPEPLEEFALVIARASSPDLLSDRQIQ